MVVVEDVFSVTTLILSHVWFALINLCICYFIFINHFTPLAAPFSSGALVKFSCQNSFIISCIICYNKILFCVLLISILAPCTPTRNVVSAVMWQPHGTHTWKRVGPAAAAARKPLVQYPRPGLPTHGRGWHPLVFTHPVVVRRRGL